MFPGDGERVSLFRVRSGTVTSLRSLGSACFSMVVESAGLVTSLVSAMWAGPKGLVRAADRWDAMMLSACLKKRFLSMHVQSGRELVMLTSNNWIAISMTRSNSRSSFVSVLGSLVRPFIV